VRREAPGYCNIDQLTIILLEFESSRGVDHTTDDITKRTVEALALLGRSCSQPPISEWASLMMMMTDDEVK